MSEQILFDRPFIAYDGSKNCELLLQIYKGQEKQFDKSTFVHVHNPDKNYIPYLVQGPQIQTSLKQSLITEENNNSIAIKLIQRLRGQDKSTNTLLLENFLNTKSTFIMLGFYGSKGQKVRKQDLASRVRRFVYDTRATVAVIKNNRQQTNTVGYCCDGSQISLDGLSKCLIFCKKFSYNLKILHSYNSSTKAFSKTLQKDLKVMLTSSKTNVKYQLIFQQHQNIAHLLKSKQCEFDWIMVTRDGYRGQISKKAYVGSKTTEILVQINCNMIVL